MTEIEALGLDENEKSFINFAIFLKHWKLISKMCEEQREEVFMKGQEGE